MLKLLLIRPFTTLKNDKILLSGLETLVKELRTTNSINKKVEMIKRRPELRRILQTIYSPESKFYVTSTSIQRYAGEIIPNANDTDSNSITDMLSALIERKVTGRAAALMILSYIKKYPEHEELIKNIIDKNLKTRIGHELIKRSFDDLLEHTYETNIPCGLGYSIDRQMKYLRKSLETGEKWYISRKYDGIRVFLVYSHYTGTVQLLTRRMKPITGLNPKIPETILKDFNGLGQSIVLDGELVYINQASEKEDFSKTITVTKSLEPKSIDNLEFRAFDLVSLGDEEIFSSRQAGLKDLFHNQFKNSIVLRLVEQNILSADFNCEDLIEKATELNYEGFMIRRDCAAHNGRSRDLLKIKPFQDAEFSVIDCQIGPMRLIDPLSGTERTEKVLLSVTIDFKGQTVHVGSGFSTSERREFGADPSKIVGKIVTVRYQNESTKMGRGEGKSLRFPVFKYLHGNERTE